MKKTGDGRRIARVEKEVQQTIARFLTQGFKIPLPGLITVTHVQMSPDLRSGKVYVSILGADDKKDDVIQALHRYSGQIQRHVDQELRMRYCPKLNFFLDSSTEKVLKVEKILRDLEQDKESKNKPTSEGESQEEE